MMVNFEILIDYFVNKFIIPFIASFLGFQIKNINSVIKHTGRFSKFKTALGSSFFIAIIMGAILQYIKFDISIIICVAVLLGTCGAEILEFISKPSGVKLVLSALGSLIGDFGKVLKVFKEVKKNDKKESTSKDDKVDETKNNNST